MVSCKLCGEPTDNADGICDDCKLSIVHTKDLPPDMVDFL